MNTLESYTIDTPFGDTGECSKFVVDDILTPFTLHNVMTNGERYTISLWIRTDSDDTNTGDTGVEEEDTTDDLTGMTILVRGGTIPVTNKWIYHSHTFPTYSTDLKIYFNTIGTYYIYHPKLERGNVATDWSESPLDIENKIQNAQNTAEEASQAVQAYVQIFNDTIQNLVTNANGASLMTQTPDGGWTFCTADLEEDAKKASDAVAAITKATTDRLDILEKSVSENNLASYVNINDDDPHNPYIELGTVVKNENGELISGEFQLRITNKDIYFMQNGMPVAEMDTEHLYITKAVIKDELSVGGFVLKQHGTRGNVGFLWKGVVTNNTPEPEPEPEPEPVTYTLTYKHSQGDVIQSGSDQTGPQECYALWIDGVEQSDLSAFSNPPRYITLTEGTPVGVVVQTASGDVRSYITFNGEKVAGNASPATLEFCIERDTTVHFEWNQWLSGLTIQSYWNCYITTN